MALSGTLKELSRAINAFIPSPVWPLPDDISDVIAAYIEKHEKFDESASERLHDELVAIYRKQVKDDPTKLIGFFAILRQLIPTIRTEARVFQWWDMLYEPVMPQLSSEKALLVEVGASIAELLELPSKDADDSSNENVANPFLDRLLLSWIASDSILPGDGDKALGACEPGIREKLLAFGKKRPKDFLYALDKLFVKRDSRLRVARLFGEFIQRQPLHLHQILQTPLFADLLRCLQQDTSTTVVSLALTALIMLLPHIPSAVAPYLPVLFNVYARLLFWDSERTGAIEATTAESDQKSMATTQGWEMCAFAPDLDDLSIPHLPNYFTMLYGLYPINFMDYIRKPQRYLRHANAESADEVEVQPTEIRHKSERLRRSHLLHPNFYSLTIESEKTDFGRWIRSDPAELVAECMALRIPSAADHGESGGIGAVPGLGSSFFSSEESDRDGLGPALLSGSVIEPRVDSWKYAQSGGADSQSSSRVHSTIHRQNSQSSHPSNVESTDNRSRDLGGDSPTLPPHLVLSTSHTQLQDMIHSNKVIKSGFHQSLANDSVPSLALSHAESVPERPASQAPPSVPLLSSPASTTDASAQVAHLQRQILILQNDLSFERYLKQQHMEHIGELRRRQLNEAATEAETQNLIMHNRNLKNQLEASKQAEMQVRKDSEKSRTLAKKWESDLSAKLKTLREESRKLKAEVETLRRELQNAKQESEKLRKMVCDGEVKELNAQQNMQSIENNATEIDRLKADVERLTISVRDFQAQEMDRQAALTAAAEAETRVEILNMKLTSREGELQRTKKLFQSQIAVLNSKLLEAHGAGQHAQTVEAKAKVESALAASRAKQSELQKQYTNLMRKYTVLQSQYQESKFTGSGPHPKHDFPFGMDGDGDSSLLSTSTSPVNVRSRPHRVLSDPDAFDSSSYNMTPPLDSKPATPIPGGTMYRPATPPGAEGSSGSGVNVSPDQRYYGRGGVQNRMRKEEKLKKKEETDKKDKKPVGIRGIRPF